MDVTTDELRAFNERLAALLLRFPAMPIASARYRLCEVGPTRVDARVFTRSMAELVNNHRPRKGRVPRGPFEPMAGILVSAECGELNARAAANYTASLLAELAEKNVRADLAPLLSKIGSELGLKVRRVEFESSSRYGRAATHAEPVFHLIGPKNGGVLVWTTDETDWLYPDDHRLWSFVQQSVQTSARPLILARKIAPATFTVLKTMGAFGLQFYSQVTRNEHVDTSRGIASTLGWYHIIGVSDLRDHKVSEKARIALSSLLGKPYTRDEQAAHAVAHDLNLPDQDRSRPDLLLEWADSMGETVPEKLRTSIRRWQAFEAYRRRRASTLAQPITQGLSSDVDQAVPEQGSAHTSDVGSDQAPRGFGRQTVVSRVPLTLR